VTAMRARRSELSLPVNELMKHEYSSCSSAALVCVQYSCARNSSSFSVNWCHSLRAHAG